MCWAFWIPPELGDPGPDFAASLRTQLLDWILALQAVPTILWQGDMGCFIPDIFLQYIYFDRCPSLQLAGVLKAFRGDNRFCAQASRLEPGNMSQTQAGFQCSDLVMACGTKP